MLPRYESKATPEQREKITKWFTTQLKIIREQEGMGTPSKFVMVRCGCNQFIHWKYMYKCLYCGVWFCKKCAEEHFGMRVAKREGT